MSFNSWTWEIIPIDLVPSLSSNKISIAWCRDLSSNVPNPSSINNVSIEMWPTLFSIASARPNAKLKAAKVNNVRAFCRFRIFYFYIGRRNVY